MSDPFFFPREDIYSYNLVGEDIDGNSFDYRIRQGVSFISRPSHSPYFLFESLGDFTVEAEMHSIIKLEYTFKNTLACEVKAHFAKDIPEGFIAFLPRDVIVPPNESVDVNLWIRVELSSLQTGTLYSVNVSASTNSDERLQTQTRNIVLVSSDNYCKN